MYFKIMILFFSLENFYLIETEVCNENSLKTESHKINEEGNY